jgi:hypothetical protein
MTVEQKGIPLTPALLVAAANSFIGLLEEGGDNRGQMIERFLAEVHQPAGEPWCAAFVYHVGYHSHFDHVSRLSSWPLPATASCYELGRFAESNSVLTKSPEIGDVFLKYNRRLGRFAHTGIVVAVEVGDQALGVGVHCCTTIEGNTNDDGSRDGHATLRKTRRFVEADGDRFIRWVKLDRRAQAA